MRGGAGEYQRIDSERKAEDLNGKEAKNGEQDHEYLHKLHAACLWLVLELRRCHWSVHLILYYIIII